MTPTPRQIRDSGFFGAIFLWIFGIIFIAASLLIWGAARHSAKNPPQVWIAALFCLVGLLVLWFAFYISRSITKYGRSIFDSPSLPALCGGVLTGTVRIPRPFIYGEPIHLRLTCTEQIGTGNQSHDIVLWEDQCTLDRFSPGAGISEFPVYFKIPEDAKPSGISRVSWHLQTKAKTAGVHYGAIFVVPIARGDAPAQIDQTPDPTLAFRAPESAQKQPMDRHIHFTPLPGGGGQIDLMPGRNLGMAIVLFLFGTAFISVALVFSVFSRGSGPGLPSWFSFIFIVVGAIVAFVGLRLLFIRTTVTIRHGVITIGNSTPLTTRTKEIRAAQISDISTAFEGQSGNRPIFSINAAQSDGSKVKICGTIHDKRDADWIVAEIKREIAAR
jgi:hypothetical protein